MDRILSQQLEGIATQAEDMERLGALAASLATAGMCFALVGDLGAGKTHWTKGFANGMSSDAQATSPTFGLVHEYRGGRLPIFHFDFYRLQSEDELIALGWDDYVDQEGIIIAEWAGKFPDLLPPQTHWLHFTVQADGSRCIILQHAEN